MAYSSYLDVQKNLQYLSLSVDSKPSIPDVTLFCDQISADIDAHLKSKGIAVPVTEIEFLPILQKTAVDGVTARVFRSLNTRDALESANAYQDEYDKSILFLEKAIPAADEKATASTVGYYKPASEQRRYQREDRSW